MLEHMVTTLCESEGPEVTTLCESAVLTHPGTGPGGAGSRPSGGGGTGPAEETTVRAYAARVALSAPVPSQDVLDQLRFLLPAV